MVGMKRSIPSVNMTIPPPRGSPIRALPRRRRKYAILAHREKYRMPVCPTFLLS